MDGAAASTSKSSCGWTWHSALNIIPPWSTLFLHIYLDTAVAGWERRVYPAAVGIALITHDFQFPAVEAGRSVQDWFKMKKKLEWSVCYSALGFLVLFQPYQCLVENTKAPCLGNGAERWCLSVPGAAGCGQQYVESPALYCCCSQPKARLAFWAGSCSLEHSWGYPKENAVENESELGQNVAQKSKIRPLFCTEMFKKPRINKYAKRSQWTQ